MKIVCEKCGKEILPFEESATVDDKNICYDCYTEMKKKEGYVLKFPKEFQKED